MQDKQAAAAAQQLDTTTEQLDTAQKQPGGMDASGLGQSLVSGLLQGIGLDGSVFSDPTQWANTKSLTALANWGGGLLQGVLGQDVAGAAGGGSLGIPGIPNIADFLKPLPAGAIQPTQNLPDAAHPGSGAAPGPSVVVNGNIGMDPREFTQRVDAKQNQTIRRNLNAVRP